jgi:CRISPR-associated endonuclease/helicase Cas3
MGSYRREIISFDVGIRFALGFAALATIIIMISFDAAFSTLTGHALLRWQRRLFDQLCAGKLPQAVDIPTGLGKTSVMAIWLIARAMGAELPRRLVYVVDRRVVVDQATAEAEKIAAALRPGQHSILVQQIREGLGLRQDQKLPVCTLRGGLADDREWTYDPAAPAIVVCTVDMGGSRLLFSGYRLSRWSRSVHAGLIGVDSLIVLDEAHIAPDFDQAVRRVLDLCSETSGTSIPPMRFLPLSATLADIKVANVFRLEEAVYNEPVVSQRTGRSRPTKLIEFQPLSLEKGALVDALVATAARFDGDERAVVVFCDSRRDAKEAAEGLRKQVAESRKEKGKEHDDKDIALITGARRGCERDKLAGEPTYRTFTYKDGKRDVPDDGRTRFLVCTAAGEVGADIDADAAVMDLVRLERMVQRLGRINRRGERSRPASVTVYYDPSALKVSASEKNESKKAEARLAATKSALEGLPSRAGHGFDASPFHLSAIEPEKRIVASTPPPKIPVIEREHVEAWALTSLNEHPGRPEVEPFLRGEIVDDEPQTTLAWRADVACLAELPDRKVEEAMATARLMPAETLEAPTREVVEVLKKRIKALRKPWEKAPRAGEETIDSLRLLLFRRGKLIGRGEITANIAVLEMSNVAAGRKRKTQQVCLDDEAKKLQDAIGNATLLLEPRFGGLSEDGALADCDEREGEMHVQPAPDDEHQWGTLIRIVPPGDEMDRKVKLLTAPPAFIAAAGEEAPCELDIKPATRGLRRVWSAELPRQPWQSDDEDGPILEYWKQRWDIDGETAASSREQSLSEHLAWARNEMERLAKRLAVPTPLADALVRAMSIHDAGKDRPGWQDGVGARREGRPYAKSDRRGPGVVRGYRHEFGSLRDAQYKNPAALDGLADDLRDLALHLIASHHGRARPAILAQDEEELFPAVLEQDALDAALRYVRLQRRWGPWGLAWLGALFRSVDATVSRRLERDDVATAPAEEAAE